MNSNLLRRCLAAVPVFVIGLSALGCQTDQPFATVGDIRVAYDEVLEADSTGDGGKHRKSYYKDATLVLTAYDTNGDGKDDLWLQYDDDLHLILEIYDTNGDGKPDKLVHLDENEDVVKVENK